MTDHQKIPCPYRAHGCTSDFSDYLDLFSHQNLCHFNPEAKD